MRKASIDELLAEVPIKYMEASAKNNVNIKESFQYLADEIVKGMGDLSAPDGSKLDKRAASKDKKKCS